MTDHAAKGDLPSDAPLRMKLVPDSRPASPSVLAILRDRLQRCSPSDEARTDLAALVSSLELGKVILGSSCALFKYLSTEFADDSPVWSYIIEF